MSRGNKRDVDRARAAARNAKQGAKKDDGLTPEQRRERYVMLRSVYRPVHSLAERRLLTA